MNVSIKRKLALKAPAEFERSILTARIANANGSLYSLTLTAHASNYGLMALTTRAKQYTTKLTVYFRVKKRYI